MNDIGKYNVTNCVHVEACWPGDPTNETKLVVSIKPSFDIELKMAGESYSN